ncbi:hypothetical protein WJX74_003353 [Apatococcus lobatus]|uniref:Aromatic amino acid beta-eliminating lyase/threonine aldolase domain-containing protein n=1 Tax=Apatococcus lobatus TaxID=904363 RepID=A0AAW1Q9V9_9CHLO
MHLTSHTHTSSFATAFRSPAPAIRSAKKPRSSRISCVAAPPASRAPTDSSKKPMTNGHQDLAAAARNDAPFKTIIEPFRMKFVEVMKMTTREQRLKLLEEANYNLFKIPAEYCLIDLLTDSGTGSMSADQWAGLMQGDESYACARSWFKFKSAVEEVTGFCNIIPTHQGRAAERILFTTLGVKDKLVLSNTLFDTTRANAEFLGAECVDMPCKENEDPSTPAPFKGNIDLQALERRLEEDASKVACLVMTVTNNSGGGQPVAMANLKAAAALCRQHKVQFYLDACRFAENSYFVRDREPGYEGKSVKSIARELFSLADGATFSAKKDGLANTGGFLISNNEDLVQKATQLLIMTEGFPTYGGLTGRDLETIAVGLREVVKEDYLEYRIASTAFLGAGLAARGIPIVEPPGGHAVYIDATAFLPDVPRSAFPGHAVAVAFFVEGGVRSCEIGELMFGGEDPITGDERRPAGGLELCRMAIPRRVYTQSHMEYLLEVAERVVATKDTLKGFKVTKETPYLRHFSADLAPL